jgi:membrane protease YdiL (CAAX protease family)
MSRGLALSLLVVALTALVSAIPLRAPGAVQTAVRFATFGLAVSLVSRVLSGAAVGCVKQIAVLLSGSVVLAALPRPLDLIAVTLLGASVEELVFRREMPVALARLLAPAGDQRLTTPSAILLSQVVFAACHLVVPGHLGAAARGLPFVGLVASGLGLSLLYRLSGTLVLPIAAHFCYNELVLSA